MESSAKRRKTSGDAKHEPAFDARLATASRFVLEAEELLKEVKLDYDKQAGFGAQGNVDSVVFKVREAIEGIEGHEGVPIWEATKRLEKKKIRVPYPDPKPAADAPYKLSYAKPSQYNVVGSYVSRTMVKSQPRHAVDMVVEMPKELFQEKDYQNMRYFYRRAYYLAYIAAGLKAKMGGEVAMEFEYLSDNHFLPVLVLRSTQATNGEESSGKDGKAKGSANNSGFVIRVIPCAPAGLFPKARLLPSCNCNKKSTGPASDQKEDAATPFYNSTLKAEETFIPYLKVITLAKTGCPAFADACILGRIWLQQRGFSGAASQGGFGNFEWSVMVALLLQTGGRSGRAALSSSLSSTELFKAVVQFLASTDISKKPFLFKAHKPGADTIREAGPVMFDPVRELNVVYKMTPWSAALLQVHAKSTLESLSNPLVDQFEPTFIAKADLPLQIFDSISELETTRGDASEALSEDQGFVRARGSEVYKVLKKAFGDRAQLVHVRWGPSSSWKVVSAPAAEETATLQIGVTFDPVHMARQMELGPPAEEQKEAAAFRSFWGDKSELRRFKDGSILECVPWSSTSPFDLCQEIMRYTLQYQLEADPSSLVFEDMELASVISLSSADKAAFDAALDAFRTLERDIRNLEGMPLHLRRLSPVSAGLRYSSIRTPSSSLQAGVLQPMDVVLFFETSNKWPENIVAIQQTKLEFLLDIDRRLSEAKDTVTTYLGRDDVELGFDNLGFLDVVYDSGAAFRLRIHSDIEEALLERQTQNASIDQHLRAEAERALLTFKWQYELLPLHTQTIATFCTRLPALSPTIRLAKHWFDRQKLSGQFGEELIELIVLHVFLHPHPFRMPSSVSTGLAQVLLFLARWDWRDEPLVVDFDGLDIPAGERSAMYKQLEEWRRRDVNMKSHVLFAATSHDRSGTAYTRTGPSRMAAMRMTGLAKAAARLMRGGGGDDDGPGPGPEAGAALFETDLGVYDVVIHLSRKELKAAVRDAGSEPGARHSRFKNLDERSGRVPLPMARHPLTVLTDVLRDVYEDTLVFYHGGPEDLAVGAVWVPRAGRQKFRVGLPFNLVGLGAESEGEGGDVVGVNRGAVLAEIARIGGPLIKRIEER